MYTRAGQAGWKALIPVYGTVVMAQIAKKPMWLGLVVGLLSIVYSFTSGNSADQSSPLGGVIALAYLAFGLYLLRAFVIQYDRNIGYWVLYLLFPVVGMFFANKANYKGNDVTPPQACDSSHSSCNTATSSTSYSTFHTSRKCSRLKRHASNTARISESAPSAIGISEQNKKW